MAVNDILFVSGPTFGPNGAEKWNVAIGATAIYSGDPVIMTLGATSVTVMATNSPVVTTASVVGIATTASTQTASADGSVYVQRILPGQVWAIKPKVAASWDTQAEYDALIGHRVLIDLTAGSYTILAADSAANGCVILASDIKTNNGKVYFSFRSGVSIFA